MNPYGKERTIALYGQEKVDRLSHAHVALFGLGGVGGYALEVLARFDRTDLDQFGAANNLTLGVNYFFNKYLRVRVNYVHAAIKDGADIDALCSRVQFSF